MSHRFALLAAASVALTWTAMTPSHADACGGMVCGETPPPDVPPDTFTPGTPVNQAGETVIYAKEPDGTLVMTVQIRYEGNSDDFVWILPVPVVPEIGVGSDSSFDALQQFTEPRFTLGPLVTTGTCREIPDCAPEVITRTRSAGGSSGDDWVTADMSVFSQDMGSWGADPDRSPPVIVHSAGQVGPYETAVIGSSDASLVVEWLNDAGFGVPDDANGPLQEYADEDYVFVALRMATDDSTNLIRPLTLRMATDEVGCLPLRLTRIASVVDMPITLYFLGDARVVPSNYSEVRVNVEEQLGLFTGGRRWSAEVGSVVDSVGGQGFVTEYAGFTPRLLTALPAVDDLSDWSSARLFVQALVERGYEDTTSLLPILTTHLEPPAGTALIDYLNCVALARDDASCGEPERFDPAAITDELTAIEVEPRRAFDELLARHGYLTRMSTAMDPDEMTVDPLFEVDPDMPTVPNAYRAQQLRRCSDEYYEDEAPIEIVIGDTTHRVDGGRFASSRPDRCNPVPPIIRYRDADGCSVSTSGRSPVGGLLLLTGLAIGIRLRRPR